MNIASELLRLKELGVKVTLDHNNDLKILGNRELLTPTVIEFLRNNKSSIREFLHTVFSAEKNNCWPLHPNQDIVWATCKFAPQNLAYNVYGSIEIDADTCIETLTAALNYVVSNNDALRIRVAEKDDGTPYQYISENKPCKIRIVEIPNWNDTLFEHWLKKAASRPFDIYSDDLWRLILVEDKKNSDGTSRKALAMICNHIVSDFGSFNILIKALDQAYLEFSSGQSSLSRDCDEKVDHLLLSAASKFDASFKSERSNYWSNNVSSSPTAINLDSTKIRPRVQSFEGDSISLELSNEETMAIREFSAKINATPFHIVLASLELIIARQIGSNDFCIGIPVSGRKESGLEQLLGHYTNPVPIVSDTQDALSVTEFILRIRNRIAESIDNELYFTTLLDVVRPARDPAISPLFQVHLAWLKTIDNHLNSTKSIVKRSLASGQLGSLTDISLTIIENADTLKFHFSFNPHVISKVLAERLARRWMTLSRKFCDFADENAFKVSILEGDLNHSRVSSTKLKLDNLKPIHKVIRQKCLLQNKMPAIKSGSFVMSYKELGESIDNVASALMIKGVKLGDRVGIAISRNEYLLPAIIGTLQAGGVYVPIDIGKQPPIRVATILKDSACGFVLTCDKTAPTLNSITSGLVLDVRAVCNTEPDERIEDWPNVSLEQLAYITYTSGSTGKPKGVAVKHLGLASLCSWALKEVPLLELKCVLFTTTIIFDISLFEMFPVLMAGGSCIVAKEEQPLNEIVNIDEVTTMGGSPSIFEMYLNTGQLPRGLKRIHLCGEVLSRKLLDKLFKACPEATILNLYGPSEDTCYSTFSKMQPGLGKPLIGELLPGTVAYILDNKLLPVPPGGIGELYLGGIGLAQGYFNQPQLTKLAFIDNPYEDNSDVSRLYKTNDMVKLNENKQLEFIGRADRQIKLRGFRIELEEVEVVLRDLDSVQNAAVVLQRNGEDDYLVAYVTPTNESVNIKVLENHLTERLPIYMVPTAIIELKEIPMSVNGKLDRKVLPLFCEKKSVKFNETISDPIEKQLQKIWKEVLTKSNFSRHDDFFSIGGHSINASRIIARINRYWELDIPQSSIMEASSLVKLANYIRPLMSN